MLTWWLQTITHRNVFLTTMQSKTKPNVNLKCRLESNLSRKEFMKMTKFTIESKSNAEEKRKKNRKDIRNISKNQTKSRKLLQMMMYGIRYSLNRNRSSKNPLPKNQRQADLLLIQRKWTRTPVLLGMMLREIASMKNLGNRTRRFQEAIKIKIILMRKKLFWNRFILMETGQILT